MKISKNENGILFEGKFVKLLILLSVKQNNNLNDVDLIFNPLNFKINLVDQINLPGEYEIRDIIVFAIGASDSNGIKLFSFDIDEIKCVFLTSTISEINKGDINVIGSCNILIVDNSKDDLNNQIKIIKELDPKILIPINFNNEELKKLSGELGSEIGEIKSKLKYVSSDFTDEESPLIIENI